MKFVPILLGILLLAPSARGASPQLVNGVAVIVGEAVITFKDLQIALEDDIEFLERRYGNQPKVLQEKLAALEKEKLEQLVENQLVLQEFKAVGYVIPESLFQNRVDEEIKRHGDRLTFTKTLQGQGLTFESYRNKIRERTIMELMWRQRVPNDPVISPARMEKYYAENRDKFKVQDQAKLSMIVVPNRTNDAAPALLAREIVTKVREGVPFAEMAKIYSQDSAAQAGGDRGWIERSVLREDLAEVAFKLKAGEVSEPVVTDNGIYIIKVDELKEAYVKTLSEAREEIESTLRADETRRLREQWMASLKKKYFVRYF